MAAVRAGIAKRARLAVRALQRRVRVKGAYLFGSHVYGKPDRWSDIDIAIFADGCERWDLFRRAQISAAVQREVGNDIELHYFPAESFRAPEPATFASYILKHGVRIPVRAPRRTSTL